MKASSNAAANTSRDTTEFHQELPDLSKCNLARPPQAHVGNIAFAEFILQTKFDNQTLVRRAITDRSHQPTLGKFYKPLDYLGDAVLKTAVLDYFCSNPALVASHWLGRAVEQLVSNKTLLALARETEVEKLIIFQRNGAVIRDPNRLEDYKKTGVMEALLGAVFLDQGCAKAMDAVKALYGKRLEKIATFDGPTSINGPLPELRAPTSLSLVERALCCPFGRGADFRNLLQVDPINRYQLCVLYSQLGIAVASLIKRDLTFGDLDGNKVTLSKYAQDKRAAFGLKEPKRLKSYQRRVGPMLTSFYREVFTDGAYSPGSRRSAFLTLGLIFRSHGYEAASAAMQKSHSGTLSA